MYTVSHLRALMKGNLDLKTFAWSLLHPCHILLKQSKFLKYLLKQKWPPLYMVKAVSFQVVNYPMEIEIYLAEI